MYSSYLSKVDGGDGSRGTILNIGKEGKSCPHVLKSSIITVIQLFSLRMNILYPNQKNGLDDTIWH